MAVVGDGSLTGGMSWEALKNAFEHDQSAARPAGSMACRKLIVFKHATALGNAPSHKLFDLVTISHWLGHASIETTNRYTKVDLETKRDAIARAALPEPGHVTGMERVPQPANGRLPGVN